MKSLILLSFIFALLSIVRGNQSDEFDNLADEKSRIRNEGIKPTPGQVIHMEPSATSLAPTAAAAPQATEASKPIIKPSKKEVKDEGNDDEKKSNKDKIVNKKKKTTSESDDEDNALPKRLFRPRFRAESSAETISASTTLISLTFALITLFFI